MEALNERTGPIANGAAQAAAVKWLLSNDYTADECIECLDAQLEENWRSNARWLTVKKDIGLWKRRKQSPVVDFKSKTELNRAGGGVVL
jgi:hypothetical protein